MKTTARRRTCRSRSGERGAALFIVVLVIVLLSAIGIFAVRVSTLVQVASGYNRRATSAGYVAELVTDLFLADQSDFTSTYHAAMQVPTNTCRETAAAKSVVSSTTIVPCLAKENSEILAIFARNNSALGTTPIGEIARPDLPIGQGVLPDVRLEMTEAHQASQVLPGTAQAGSGVTTTIFETSYTVTSRLYPPTTGALCSDDGMHASAISKLRAFVLYPVVP